MSDAPPLFARDLERTCPRACAAYQWEWRRSVGEFPPAVAAVFAQGAAFLAARIHAEPLPAGADLAALLQPERD